MVNYFCLQTISSWMLNYFQKTRQQKVLNQISLRQHLLSGNGRTAIANFWTKINSGLLHFVSARRDSLAISRAQYSKDNFHRNFYSCAHSKHYHWLLIFWNQIGWFFKPAYPMMISSIPVGLNSSHDLQHPIRGRYISQCSIVVSCKNMFITSTRVN